MNKKILVWMIVMLLLVCFVFGETYDDIESKPDNEQEIIVMKVTKEFFENSEAATADNRNPDKFFSDPNNVWEFNDAVLYYFAQRKDDNAKKYLKLNSEGIESYFKAYGTRGGLQNNIALAELFLSNDIKGKITFEKDSNGKISDAKYIYLTTEIINPAPDSMKFYLANCVGKSITILRNGGFIIGGTKIYGDGINSFKVGKDCKPVLNDIPISGKGDVEWTKEGLKVNGVTISSRSYGSIESVEANNVDKDVIINGRRFKGFDDIYIGSNEDSYFMDGLAFGMPEKRENTGIGKTGMSECIKTDKGYILSRGASISDPSNLLSMKSYDFEDSLINYDKDQKIFTIIGKAQDQNRHIFESAKGIAIKYNDNYENFYVETDDGTFYLNDYEGSATGAFNAHVVGKDVADIELKSLSGEHPGSFLISKNLGNIGTIDGTSIKIGDEKYIDSPNDYDVLVRNTDGKLEYKHQNKKSHFLLKDIQGRAGGIEELRNYRTFDSTVKDETKKYIGKIYRELGARVVNDETGTMVAMINGEEITINGEYDEVTDIHEDGSFEHYEPDSMIACVTGSGCPENSEESITAGVVITGYGAFSTPSNPEGSSKYQPSLWDRFCKGVNKLFPLEEEKVRVETLADQYNRKIANYGKIAISMGFEVGTPEYTRIIRESVNKNNDPEFKNYYKKLFPDAKVVSPVGSENKESNAPYTGERPKGIPSKEDIKNQADKLTQVLSSPKPKIPVINTKYEPFVEKIKNGYKVTKGGVNLKDLVPVSKSGTIAYIVIDGYMESINIYNGKYYLSRTSSTTKDKPLKELPEGAEIIFKN